MNAWPILREWFQFGGTLALELAVIFAVAKLVALRLRSAQGRRALWQIAVLALLLVTAGELNGVRGWMRWPEKKTAPALQTKLVVTFTDVEPSLDLFGEGVTAETTTAMPSQPASSPSHWQQRAVWPALLWAAGAGLILLRMGIALGLAFGLRLAARRSGGPPSPLFLEAPVSNRRVQNEAGDRAGQDAGTPGKSADMAVRDSDGSGLSVRVRRLAAALGLRRPVALLTSAQAATPFTFGAWRPVIVLPHNFSTAFTPEQQDAALAHELAHVAGFDSAWRCFSQFACAVLWWFPLVWLARRELDHASELVADEASLLVAHGPDRLAECLLACAKELRRPALAGWLGMDGGGFRSALGQRVARLLELPPHTRLSRPMPWYLRLLAPVVGVALLWIGMSVVLKSGEPRGAWRKSILGSAFAAAVEAKTHAQVAETNRAAVAQQVPGETAAVGASRDTNGPGPRFTSVKRQALVEKLRRIRFSQWGPIDNLPLSEVVRGLNDGARRLDPEHTGVNFIINSNPFPLTGESGLPAEPSDIRGTTLKITNSFKNLTLEEVLDIVTTLADRRIKYSVEDYGVIISPNPSPKGEEPEPLHTRIFRIDPNSFQQGMNSILAQFTTNLPSFDVPRSGQITNTNRFKTELLPAEIVIPSLRQWFKTMGVDLNAPNKAIFYNDRLGVLMVRATSGDLDTMEKGLQFLNMSPPQVSLRIKVMEMPVTASQKTASWYLGNDLTTNSAATVAASTNVNVSITGILTDEQYRQVVRAMGKSGGTDLLNAPEVTTQSGRQAQIKAVDIRYIITDLDIGANNPKSNQPEIQPIAEPFELGPVIDVIPYVQADGYTIQMTVTPSLKEFLGYDDPATVQPAIAGAARSRGQTSPMPLPKFRLRKTTTTARIWDGQTLVIGAGNARDMKRDRDTNGTITTNYTDKSLFFFITARLIDPAGNPIHPDKEVLSRRTN